MQETLSCHPANTAARQQLRTVVRQINSGRWIMSNDMSIQSILCNLLNKAILLFMFEYLDKTGWVSKIIH